MIQPRILHTGDWHLGARLHGHSRHQEQMERVGEIAEIAVREQVSMLLIAGDILDRRLHFQVASKVIGDAARQLAPVADAGIPIVILGGNHDPPEFLDMIREISSLTLSRGSATLAQPLRVIQNATIEMVGGVQLVCLPYPSRELLAAEIHGDGAGLDPVLARNQAVTDGLRQILVGLVNSPRFRANVPAVLTAHFTMSNAKIPGMEEQVSGGFQHDFVRDFVFPASAVPNRFVYGAFGHIHLPQDLHRSRTGAFPFPSRYCGSPVRLNIGEHECEKSVTIASIRPDNSVDLEVIPLTQTKMARLELDVALLDEMERDRSRYADIYVQVKLHHDGSILPALLVQRLGKLFPRHVGIELLGPTLSIRDVEARVLDAAAPLEGRVADVSWNLADHEGTLERFLRERLANHSDLAGILERARAHCQEYERIHYGDAQAELGIDTTESTRAEETTSPEPASGPSPAVTADVESEPVALEETLFQEIAS